MNEQPLYEQQIASKLEQLPVPDMADAIWLRIKNQLDTDMPTGGHTPPPPPPPSPRNSGHGKARIPGILVASIVLIYFIIPKKQTSHPIPKNISADSVSTSPAPAAQQSGQPPANKTKKPVPVLPDKQQDTAASGLVTPVFPMPVQLDTLVPLPVITAPAIIPSTPLKQDSVPAKKKPRGVKGISDGDYKIVPKNNNNPG